MIPSVLSDSASLGRAARIPVSCPVTLHLPGMEPLVGTTDNLSLSGLAISLSRDVVLGLPVRLVIELPDDRPPLEIAAMAVRRDAEIVEGRMQLRIGMHFMIVPKEVEQRLAAILFADRVS